MENEMEYNIITGESLNKIIVAVNAVLEKDEGWEPVGQPFYNQVVFGSSYCQAMYKRAK